MKSKAITAALCALCALALTAAAQESAPAGPFPPDRSAPRRARAQDIRPPVVAARLWAMSVCGANGYLVKDSAGGYFMFTTHTPDMPHRFTVDYPYTITGAEDPGPPADPGSEFESRPLDDGERKLLAGLLRQWRDAAIPRATLRRFERYDKLKGEAAIKKALESMSEEEQDLLGMWYVIRELEGRREWGPRRVALRNLIRDDEGRELVGGYTATPRRLSMNFACPTGSQPSSLFICPCLIICNASMLAHHTIFNHVT